LKTATRDAGGDWTYFGYDAVDRVSDVQDARGNITSYTYNDRGQVTAVTNADTSVVQNFYDAYGSVTNRVDELGHATHTTFDEFKRVLSVTDSLQRSTLYSYGTPGGGCGCSSSQAHPTSITLPSGKVTAFLYDIEWEKIGETVGYGSGDAATTTYSYDAAGNVTSVTDPRGKVWTTSYDNRNRRISSTDPLTHTTSWVYDAAGNNIKVTRPDSGITTNVYDSMNRLVWTRDPKQQVTQFGYDAAGNMTSLTDARTNTYYFAYDLDNRRTRMTYPGGSHEDYTYDEVANLKTYTNRDGNVRAYFYDERNRETYSAWDDGGTPAIGRSYDAAGRLLTLTNGVSALSYGYDNANQLTNETSAIVGQASRLVSYSYDGDGNRFTLTYPDGTVVTNSYTARNQLASVSSVVQYSYDLAGNRTGKTLGNATATSYAYDDASRLLSLIHSNAAGVLARFDYALNNVGNRTSKTESGIAVPAVHSESYAYDPIDQLTAVDYATNSVITRSVSYGFDPVGNRTNVVDNSVPTAYSPNNLNQYLAVGGGTLTYDRNGNLSSVIGLPSSADWTYTYDAQNRLISATSTNARMDMAYDARNRCVHRAAYTNDAGSWLLTSDSFLTYDGWSLLEERDAAGTLLDKYIHGAAIDELIVRYNDSPLWYHHDGLGSTIALTDNAGALTESYTFDIFGAASVFDSTGSPVTTSPITRFLFTGREYLAEIGLYDCRNRVYSQTFGRFLQTDPKRFEGNDSNLYRYVENDIVNKTDPSGLDNPGCDFPIWPFLGRNTCFLRCCAQHDECYRRHKCGAWWSWPLIWCPLVPCAQCNIRAVGCFLNCMLGGEGPRTGGLYYCPRGRFVGRYYDTWAAIPVTCFLGNRKPDQPGGYP
jgi:RHS repeat-associated protein